MTDDIEKIISKEVGDWTEEDKIRILGPRDTYTRMKCSGCGYEENVPDWYSVNLKICTNKKRYQQNVQDVMEPCLKRNKRWYFLCFTRE